MSSKGTSLETNVAADKDNQKRHEAIASNAGERRGGRKSYAQRDPELVAAAKKLAHSPIAGRKRSLRDVAAALEEMGYVTETGKRYAATAVSKMLYD